MILPRFVYAVFLASLLAAPSLFAEVKPNGLFCDNAVLQQGAEVPVWGTAREGERVTVQIGDQKVITTAKDGRWMVRLKNLKAGGPYTMTISGDNKIVLNNLLVGEVWLCSGQSNMERQLGLRSRQKPIDNYQQEAAVANYPEIREFHVPNKMADQPQTAVASKWNVCDPQTVLGFSAVGYFFGSEIHKKMKVPVGLIHSSWGGTPAEAWTAREALDKNVPEYMEFLAKATATYAEALSKYKAAEPELLAKWQKDCEAAKQQSKPLPRKPMPPGVPVNGTNRPSCIYNGMIHPLVPYAIRGVIWYQGESNAGHPKIYQTLFPALIANWRQVWNQGEFPFLFVQIAPFGGQPPEIREAQFLTWKKTPNTAMAVLTDVGDPRDIHPSHKRPVGERLALAARALAYGERLEYSGPAFSGMTVQGSQAVLTFTHCGSGLVAKGGELRGFVIAGEDGKFVPAKAEIAGNTVVVTSATVLKPKAVRYGWANVPDVNLFNKEGLPASPFRSDTDAIK